MKVRECYEQFDWPTPRMYFTSLLLPARHSAIPRATKIKVNRVMIEGNVLVFYLAREGATMRVSMRDKNVAEALHTAFSTRLALAENNSLSLQELGDTEIDYPMNLKGRDVPWP